MYGAFWHTVKMSLILTSNIVGPKPRQRLRLAVGLVSLTLCYASGAMAIPFDQIQDKAPVNPPDVSHVPDAKPTYLPYSKYGNPIYYDVNGVRYHVLSTSRGYKADGFASWYGTKFQGRRTSSGEPYNMYAMTAASTTLPIPSFVRVTNLANGKSVVVKVNDRGPFHTSRIMDLSYAAADKLDMLQHGTAPVRVEALNTGQGQLSNDRTADSGATYAHSDNDNVRTPGPFGGSTFVNDDNDEVHTPGPFSNASHDNVRTPGPFGRSDNENGRTFVQVASFSKPSYANQLANNIRSHVSKPVTISTVAYNDSAHYRVLIGPLRSTHEAVDVQSNLRRQGLGDGVVVQA